MAFYFREKPKFGDKLRGKSGDELLQELKQQFDEDSKSFFEPSNRPNRDSFERHSTFPRGFPFDDDGFGRRTNIRNHLDDLVARHPDLADHLLGPPWGDIPFHDTLRNRRRGSGSYQGHPDEDARSQASGSSAASAASGASGVSSHGEPETTSYNNQQDSRRTQNFEPEVKRTQIPQYGLRNTVDIGQHRHNMENLDKANRGQRSMSAPPENRQSVNQQPNQQEQSSQQPGQRFVSRVDITPQHNQPQPQCQPQPQVQQQKPQPQPQQQTQKPQQQSNVRHIPIFVEGRDEPVIPKNRDESHFRREPSPTQFYTPNTSPFQRPAPFRETFTSRQPTWSSHFQEPFYPSASPFEQPPTRRQQQSPNYQQQAKQQQYERQPRPESQQQHYEQRKQPQRQQQPPQQPEQQPEPQPEPPKPKQIVPKDPLERVAMVQKEVDALAEQVKAYTGNSRTDKEYIYLDEMLTRELIKLDDIETEGRENVRQTRKNAIKCIQQTISLLESKAPLPSQQETPNEENVQEQSENNAEEANQCESMDVDQKQEEQQPKEPIPLPPGPSSPTKKSVSEAFIAQEVKSAADQATQPENCPTGEPMDTTTPAEKMECTPMDVQQSTENVNSQPVDENKKVTNVPEENKVENANDEKKAETAIVEEKKIEKSDEGQETVRDEQKMEVESNAKPVKSPKKGKKTKKQTPVSEEPIPLPPPESNETKAK